MITAPTATALVKAHTAPAYMVSPAHAPNALPCAD